MKTKLKMISKVKVADSKKVLKQSLLISFLLFFNTAAFAEVATFAGGCFWCMEPPFEKLTGVSTVISGYMGGSKENANYKAVSSGSSKHLEVVQVTYDPKKVDYKKLVEIFWMNVDPTQTDGQFVDKGDQYKTAIFYHSEEQRKMAMVSKKKLDASKRYPRPIYTKIKSAQEFYPAEEYHQDYYKKSSFRYKLYRVNSGRDDHIKKYWPKKN
jgi:peptide methionine sulfoxide reductase msrA/msrB